MDRDGPQATLDEEPSHEVRVPLGHAEGEGPRATALLQLLECILGARLGGDRVRQRFFVEASVAPGDVPVVDLVRHAEISEWSEQPSADAIPEIVAIDEVLGAQGEQVAPIRKAVSGKDGNWTQEELLKIALGAE